MGQLGAPRASQEQLRGGLGRSWGGLGRSWGGLGAVWSGLGAVLGGSWGDLNITSASSVNPIPFLLDLGPEKGAKREAFWEPKWHQNGSQNEVNI